jgi:hypothetical protein
MWTVRARESTRPWNGRRVAICAPTRRSACSSSTPTTPARFIQIRGDAELVTDGALDHLDTLTRRYTRHPAYDGYIYPVAQRSRETRVSCRIHARRSTLDAIHA